MPYLKLKVCNWGVATSEVIGLLSEFAERGFINAGEVLYYQLLYRTAGANPHDVVFGKAFVYSEAFISLILAHSKNPAAPSLPEVREILNAIPGLADAYELDVKGEDWKLSLKAPLLNRAFHPSDWTAHDWELFFDMGSDDLHFLSWPGSQFHRLIGSFAMLNGDRTEAEIYDSWGGDTRYLDYFLGFVAAAGLLLRSEHPFQSPAEEHAPAAGIELLCHSSLRIRQGSDHILVDPVLLVPPPLNRTPAYAERFDRLTSQFAGVTGVMISHHHWDHLNLQTLARIPRHIPIYIPPHTKTSRNTGCNPDIAAFLASIGFTKIVPLEWNSEHPVGDTRVTGLPFYGEWFGPDSAFDGCTFLAAINSKRMLATVDADRDERGDMQDVFERFASSNSPTVDYLFFCCTGQQHRCPTFCGAPFTFSNTYGRDLAARMRYHPDREVVARWCGTLKPRYIIPYAEFIFHNESVARPPLALNEAVSTDQWFQSYWNSSLKSKDEWIARWKTDLEALQEQVNQFGTKIVMLAPGEMLIA